MVMLPLFKTHYSIGKSILTLDEPQDSLDGLKSDSVFQIAKDNALEQLILVEDSMCGFLEAYKKSQALGIQLIFGLRLSICDTLDEEVKHPVLHKVIIFITNGNGYKNLVKIYTEAFAKNDGCLYMRS